MARPGRQLSAADATLSNPVFCGATELDESMSAAAAVGGVPAAARSARSCTSPPTGYYDGGESRPEHGASSGAAADSVAETAGGEQTRDGTKEGHQRRRRADSPHPLMY